MKTTGFEEFINEQADAEMMLNMIYDYVDNVTRLFDFLDSDSNALEDMPEREEQWKRLRGTLFSARQSLYWVKMAIDKATSILTDREEHPEKYFKIVRGEDGCIYVKCPN